MSPRSSSVGSFAAESLHSASPWSGTKDDRVLLHFQFTRPILHARGLKVPAKQPSAAGSGWPIDRAFGYVNAWRSVGHSGSADVLHSPWRNGLVERLIGSARRECTDHVIVFTEDHLRRILSKYASYYNEVRTHLSLGKDATCRRPIERVGDIIAQPILGGLHHR